MYTVALVSHNQLLYYAYLPWGSEPMETLRLPTDFWLFCGYNLRDNAEKNALHDWACSRM